MARKDPGAFRGRGDIPKAFRKSKSRKAEGSVKDAGPRVPDNGNIDLEIREDGKGLYVRADGRRIPPSSYSDRMLVPGEVWTCMIDRSSPMGPSFIAVMKVSDAPEPVPESVPEDPVPDVTEVPVPAADVPRVTDPEVVRSLRREISELKERNNTLMNKASKVDDLNGIIEERDRTIADQRRSVESLKRQVEVLSSRDSSGTITNLESEIGRLNDIIESKDLEIERLRAKLKSMGVDDLQVVPHMPRVPKAFLIGSGTIRCTILDDGRYTVLVNPRAKRIRITPDASGRVSCYKGAMDIGCIASFSRFDTARSLQIEEVGGSVEIQL